MPKNRYAMLRSDLIYDLTNTGIRVGLQMHTDYMCIALNEMGFGYDRLSQVVKRIHELEEEFGGILNERKFEDADVQQEHLDALLREICKGHDFLPFADRYPEVLRRKY